MDESALLARMQLMLPVTALESPDLRSAVWGDDAAVIAGSLLAADRDLVVTQDLLVEDVDFRWDWSSPEDVGFKALQVNLSDLAAKGAEPRYAFIAVACEKDQAEERLPRIYAGIGEACADAPSLVIAGGDLSATDGPLVISITLIGDAPRGGAWLRSAELNEGDIIWISRPVGWARLGLLAMQGEVQLSEAYEQATEQFLRPRAELALSRVLRSAGYTGACMDLSDGLQRDLPRLCAASEIGALIADPSIAQPPGYVELCAELEVDPVENAIRGGEDFALLGATSLAEFERVSHAIHAAGLRLPIPIGAVMPTSHGITLEFGPRDGAESRSMPWPEGGFDHFTE